MNTATSQDGLSAVLRGRSIRSGHAAAHRRLAAATASLLLLLGACSSADVASADADHFAGLDPTVVAEVVDNPVVAQRLDEEPPETRASLAQGIARNFIVCRDAFRVYQDWITTGAPPPLAPLPIPDNPVEPSNTVWEREYEALQARIASGEPQQLRFWLTAEGSCGQWIPANPGEPQGPTIGDVIEGSS